MLIPNVLFRANGSAVLLSNKSADMRRSKYFIRNVVRTHLAADDVAYNCVIQMEDAERNVGTSTTACEGHGLLQASCSFRGVHSQAYLVWVGTSRCTCFPAILQHEMAKHAPQSFSSTVAGYKGASCHTHGLMHYNHLKHSPFTILYLWPCVLSCRWVCG